MTDREGADIQLDEEIADAFVDPDELLPDRNGAVPLYSGHPPDTYLPMWRCPCCGEAAPTMKDVWKLYKRRERLVDEKNKHGYPDEEWSAYQEGIQEINRQISRICWALPSEVSAWIRREVEPSWWDESDLNPENYEINDREVEQ